MSNDCQVFISYRRSDTAGHARALHRDLVRRFGPTQIFFDRSGIESGDRFDELLREKVISCRVLLALIGPNWLDARDSAGQRRLDDDSDFVRLEIGIALEREKNIIPVLFDDVSIPSADGLPETLKRLSQCDAHVLSGKTYQYDRQLEELVRLLKRQAPDLHPRIPTLVKAYDELFRAHRLFAGRKQELSRMDLFIAERSQGHLLITGRSASGKTALMAHWIKSLLDREDLRVIFHFLNRKLDTASETEMLRSLCQQLLEFVDWSEAIPAALDELRVLYARLIEVGAPGYPLVVVIDGLDEAASTVPWQRHIPRNPAEGVFIAFSARALADVDWVEQLSLIGTEVETIDLDQHSLNLGDVRELLLAAGDRTSGFAADEAAVLELDRVSEGDPLLLRFLVEDISIGKIEKPADLAKIPQGLESYLKDWWKAISDSTAREAHVLQLLGYLVFARGRLNRDDLIDIDLEDSLNGVTVDNAMETLHRFVLGDEHQGYVLCHPRFQDYITQKVLRGDTRYRERILAYCGRWSEHGSRYALAAYTGHLIEEMESINSQLRPGVFQRLVNLLTDEAFQRAYMKKVVEFGTLNENLQTVLQRVPDPENEQIISGVIRLALEATTLQRRWLDPETIFKAAASPNPRHAEKILELFGPDHRWREIALAVIAWLAGRKDPDIAREFLDEHSSELAPQHMWYALLPERVKTSLDGLTEPELIIPYAGPFGLKPLPEIDNLGLARALVARIGGQLQLNPSAFDHEALHPSAEGITTFSQMDYDDETPTYVVENDSPQLVAIAVKQPAEGMELLQKYIAVHAANPYGVYRNRSLFGIVGAVICHPDLDTVMNLLQRLITRALQPSGAEYTEPLLIALTALMAADGDIGALQRLEEMSTAARQAAEQLYPERAGSDSWGHHCRRLAMLAEAYTIALGDTGVASSLLEQAQKLPFGYAGFQAPASLSLAEAFRINQPQGPYPENAINRAMDSAHKVQEPPFCAFTTVHVNAMKNDWWHSPIAPVGKLIERFCEDPEDQRFTALHIVGETFGRSKNDDPDMLPIPQKMLDARSLEDIAGEIFHLPVSELIRVNPGLNPDQPLVKGTPLRIPDPGFTPLLAARLSAEVLAHRKELDAKAPGLLVSLVPIALINQTALHLVLARLLLALGPSAVDIIAVVDELTPRDWMRDPARPVLM